MKFRYYVTDINNGTVSGTNDPDLAHDLSLIEGFFVADTESGMWLNANSDIVDIKEFDE